ncbi:MAG: nucleotidyltransferase family protein [Chloroflexi bacterium]|nr:nucleotidyltransferase family protein [Chloroflexota bacterium]
MGGDRRRGSIAGLILAAGESKRMGRPKMSLPWGGTTVIGQVAATLHVCGLRPLIAVTGGAAETAAAALAGLPGEVAVRCVFNPHFAAGEMLSSLQVGVAALGDTSAVLIALGDQPQIEAEVVDKVLAAYEETGASLVIPSRQMRRGHPILISRELWPDLLALRSPATLRDFLSTRAAEIYYVLVENNSIFADIDTPEDFERHRPKE